MKIVGTITETLVLSKTVEVDVPMDATQGHIDTAIREEAYKQTIFEHENIHGWQCDEVLDVDIKRLS